MVGAALLDLLVYLSSMRSSTRTANIIAMKAVNSLL
jgi:hypothetical protein